MGIGLSKIISFREINYCNQYERIIKSTGYFVWGSIFSVQASFYPTEALKRGVNLAQVLNFIVPK